MPIHRAMWHHLTAVVALLILLGAGTTSSAGHGEWYTHVHIIKCVIRNTCG